MNIIKQLINVTNSKIILLVICLIVTLFNSAWALDNPEAKVTRVIEEYIVAANPDFTGKEIKVTFKFADKTFARLREYDEDINLKIVDVYQDFRPVGNVIFPIEVSRGETSKKFFIRTKVEVFKKIVVANNKIKRGKVINEDDLVLEKRDIAMLPQKYFEEPLLVANNEAKTTISRNGTIFEWMIKKVPLVHRGDEVAINVVGSDLLVKSAGVILMDGYLGESVKVKRKNSKKTVEGVLVSADVVEVNLK